MRITATPLVAFMVGRGFFDLGDAGLEVRRLAAAVHDGGVLFLDPHLLAEHGERDVLELDAEVFRHPKSSVKIAMSCSTALRRSPGAVTAPTLRPPRSLSTMAL